MSSDNNQTVRYFLKESAIFYGKMIDNNFHSNTRFKIESSSKQPVFLDILEKVTPNITKVKLYLPDGGIIKEAYFSPRVLDLIGIFNYEALFDGRFNS